MRNLNDFMTKILNLQLEINNSFFGKTKFVNKDVEEKFQIQNYADNNNPFLLGEIMINLGYFASLIYILFAYYKLIFLCIILVFWGISLILIYISHKKLKNNVKVRKYINFFLVFLISTALNFKANLISLHYTDEIGERYGELIRVIIYDFFSTNLFLIIIDEGNLKSHVFYFSYNLISIIIAQNYSKKNYFFYLEILTSFFTSFIFYFFRKAWDYKLRSLFAEKFKIEKFFLYTRDFINGLDAYHLNFKNKDVMFLNEKFINLLEEKSKVEKNQYYSKNEVDIENSNSIFSEKSRPKLKKIKFGSIDNEIADSIAENLDNNFNKNQNEFENENENENNIFSQERILKIDLNNRENEKNKNKISEENNYDNENSKIYDDFSEKNINYLDIADDFMNSLKPYNNSHIDENISHLGNFIF